MLNKKGDISLKKIFEILLVVIVAGALLANAYRISQVDTYALKNLAVDLSFEISAVTALKHDSNSFAAFNFPFETNVVILPNKVALSREKVYVEYYFSANPAIKIKYNNFENIKILYLTKSGNQITFSADKPGSLKFYFCEKIDLNLDEVTFDPGENFLEVAALLSFEPNFKFTRLKEAKMSIADKKAKVVGALISVYAGDFNDDIKIYTNNNEASVVLACNLMNALLKNLDIGEFTDFAVVPVNFDFIPEDDKKQILNIEKPAVLLELGTKFIASKKAVVESIKEGVKNV